MSNSHHHNHDLDFKKAFTVKKELGSIATIEGEIPYSEIIAERSAAIKTLGKNLKLDGFRPGHVPEAILVKQLGEMTILGEMAERSISHMYPHIIEAHELDPVGHPKVEIKKLAPENPLVVTFTVAIMPEVTLPDYQKIAKDINAKRESDEVNPDEIDKQISEIQRQRLAYERLQKKAALKSTDNLPTPETINEEVDVAQAMLPELTDEYVQGLGQPGQFPDVATFKDKIKEHLTLEKKGAVRASHRAKITDAIVEKSLIDLPQILIDSEIQQMFAQMEEDLKRANFKFDDYLNHIKKLGKT
jgi:FKBP-type peptidyl-prolyl cis-trans isomerase (trigger factor)